MIHKTLSYIFLITQCTISVILLFINATWTLIEAAVVNHVMKNTTTCAIFKVVFGLNHLCL